MVQKHLRVYLVCLLFLVAALISCGQLPLPIPDCQSDSSIIAGRVVRYVGHNTPDFKIVGIPNARVELTSIQTTFNCPGASGIEPIVFTTDAEGFFKGATFVYPEDLFKLHITADGCNLYEEAPMSPVLFGEGSRFVLECE